MTHHAEQSPMNIRMMKTGVILAGGGMMTAAIGMAVAAVAMTRGAIAWSRQREVSPAAMMAAKLDQAKHASLAGMHAWQEHAAAGTDGHRGHM